MREREREREREEGRVIDKEEIQWINLLNSALRILISFVNRSIIPGTHVHMHIHKRTHIRIHVNATRDSRAD